MYEAVPPATPPAEDNSAQTFNRHIVEQCLPSWLTTGTPWAVGALAKSLRTGQRASHRLRSPLKSLPTAQAFAAPLLTEALRKQFGSELNIDTDFYLQGKSVLVRDMRPVGNREWRTEYHQQSLLQAALHNFEASAAVAPNLNRLEIARPVSLLPEQFAHLCRTLDIGGKYQALLNAFYNPPANSQETAAQARARVRSQFKDSKRHDLAVAAHVALLHSQISEPVHAMLLRVSELDTDVMLDGLKVRHKRLSMLGQPLTNIMVFETSSSVSRPEYAWVQYELRKLVVYVPNDPVSPLTEYMTWEACEDDLRTRLGQADYRRFFCGFVPHKDAAVFCPALESTLKQNAGLRLVTHIVTGEPFADRVERAIEKVFADARFQAVPTADQDLKSLQDSRRKTEELGLNLLNVAAFFVPGLGELMFGVAAYQLLGKVYEGIEDWSDGHKQEALADMVEVAKTVAVTALMAGATVAVKSVYSRFFRELMPISLDNGQTRLWHKDLTPYEVEHSSEADISEIEPGLFKKGDQHSVRIEGKTYSARFDETAGKWRLWHPTRTQAYAPILERNGAGAWRMALDNPLEWQGSPYLFKRLGDDFRQFDDDSIEQILTVTGLDEDALRCIHLDNAKPPGHLLDTVGRFQLDRDLTRFIDKLESADSALPLADSLAGLREDSAFDTVWKVLDEQQRALTTEQSTQWTQSLTTSQIAERAGAIRNDLFERLYCARNNFAPGAETLVKRDFPGLPLAVVKRLLERATDAEHLRFSTEQRIPLRLAESAREMLRTVRLTRAKEGFYLDSVDNADTDKLTLHLLEKLPGWPVDTRVEIRAQTQDGAVLDCIGDAQATWLGVLAKDTNRYSPAEPEELAPPLSSVRPHSLFSSLFSTVRIDNIKNADDLRLTLAKLAASQRQDAERILGLVPRPPHFNPPLRLGKNRVGYQLSGRGDPAPARPSITGLVRKLYPDYSNFEIDHFLFSLRLSGANVREVLQQREKQYLQFDLALSRWEHQPGTSSSTKVRAQISHSLRRCWRRQTPRLDHPDGRLLGYRLSLEASHPGQLPELPKGTDLSHVVDLNLYGMQLSEIPDGFLRHFSATRWLDLGNNSLDRLPTALKQMPELRGLNLQSNRIRLRAADILDLSQLRKLEELNLSGNPLGQAPDVTQLQHLQILRLRDTGIEQLPNGLFDRRNLVDADLRDNQIRELPEELFGAPPQTLQRIFVHDNPLSDASRRRLATVQHNHGLDLDLGEQVNDAASLEGTDWLPATDDPLRLQKQQTWARVAAEPRARHFIRLLANLTETSDFRLVREDLTGRVWNVVEAAFEHTELRNELFELAATPTRCSDTFLVNFSALEVKTLVFKARSAAHDTQNSSGLLALARGLFRLKRLEHIAREDIKSRAVNPDIPEENEQELTDTDTDTNTDSADTGVTEVTDTDTEDLDQPAVDEIEVSLAYRTGLAQRLALPGQPKSMSYKAIADVTDAMLDTAEKQVLADENTPQLQAFIVEQDFWVEFLKQKYAMDFAQVKQPFRDDEARLIEQPDVSSEEYEKRYKALAADWADAEHSLIQRLTERELAKTAATTENAGPSKPAAPAPAEGSSR